MLLETCVQSVEILAVQGLHRYIKKAKNMPNCRLPHLVGNVGCKLQKNQNNKIVSSGWVVDIKKWFERWYVEGLFELSSDVMNYVVIGERLAEPLEGIIGKMLKRQN